MPVVELLFRVMRNRHTFTGALTLDGSSVLNFELGTSSDLIAVTGALTLDGTLNVTAVAGFGIGYLYHYDLYGCHY